MKTFITLGLARALTGCDRAEARATRAAGGSADNPGENERDQDPTVGPRHLATAAVGQTGEVLPFLGRSTTGEAEDGGRPAAPRAPSLPRQAGDLLAWTPDPGHEHEEANPAAPR